MNLLCRINSLCLFGLLMATQVAQGGRDPFLPPARQRCTAQADVNGGQLFGVVGNNRRWTGWGQDGSGRWLRFSDGAVLPQQDWQVASIGASHVELVPLSAAVTSRCSFPSRLTLYLHKREE